ncbi:potassium transporter [Thermoplasmatales archaeon ex4484_6]|nr:MAG: potassium transporter [Thermoplasmatales archaeon ex4484_6]RLF68448.1 MAG: TrkH family potassium uptake protein [Thermoplasmata archaeon]
MKGIVSGVGTILMIFPFSLIFPFIVGLLYKEDPISLLKAFILPGMLGLSLGSFLTAWAGRADKTSEDLRPVEALVIVAVTWVLIAVIGALPYMLSGTLTGFVDAFFESMSGFTTTGASVLNDIDSQSHSILFWRALTQWIGGLGVIVLMVAVFSILLGGPKAGLLLMKGEVPGHKNDRMVPRLKDTAKLLWGIYAILTALEIILLTAAGLNLYDAVCHTFTTLSTGGFGTHTESIAYYKDLPAAPLIELIFVVFMIFGSVNFVLHYNLLKGNWRAFLKDTEFKVYMFMLLTFWCIVAVNVAWNMKDQYTPAQAMWASVFNVTSMLSTTGYATEDFGNWPLLSQFIMLVAMLTGGMTGSTSGAIKTARLIIAYKAVGRSLRRIGRPKAKIPLRVGDVIFNERIVRSVGVFIFGYLAIFALGSFMMTLTGMDAVTSLSSIATTMGGVGPGLNMVGPALNFSNVTTVGKLLLCFFMWLGRLELVTALVLFFPSTYKM